VCHRIKSGSLSDMSPDVSGFMKGEIKGTHDITPFYDPKSSLGGYGRLSHDNRCICQNTQQIHALNYSTDHWLSVVPKITLFR
jgi:hypothetical protein